MELICWKCINVVLALCYNGDSDKIDSKYPYHITDEKLIIVALYTMCVICHHCHNNVKAKSRENRYITCS